MVYLLYHYSDRVYADIDVMKEMKEQIEQLKKQVDSFPRNMVNIHMHDGHDDHHHHGHIAVNETRYDQYQGSTAWVWIILKMKNVCQQKRRFQQRVVCTKFDICVLFR
jgi:hypothetical protein